MYQQPVPQTLLEWRTLLEPAAWQIPLPLGGRFFIWIISLLWFRPTLLRKPTSTNSSCPQATLKSVPQWL